jgi:NTE family protein
LLAAERDSNPGIAVCLSGGGFRAALFHLGALRRLRELGLLHEVALVSSVSGGSILSGFLADRVARAGNVRNASDFAAWLDAVDWDGEVAAPFREVTSHDLRTWPVLKNLLWNWAAPGFRVRDLERGYARRISKRTLGELPVWPEFVFCATNLTFGVNWVFSRALAGDYQVGYLAEAAGWPLARAIAASSSFPLIFGPLPVRADPGAFHRGHYRGVDRDWLVARTALTDGGVYDNLGLEPAWKEYGTVLVSDCGAPFDFRFGTNPIRRLLRYTSVVMNQASSVRKRLFFEKRRRGAYEGTYWGIRSSASEAKEGGLASLDEEDSRAARVAEVPPSTPGYSRALVDEVLARVRTDLDAFTEAEQKVLENHGYFAANHSLVLYLERPIPRPAPMRPPHPEWLDENRVRAALASSGKRLSLSRSVRVLLERRASARKG